MAGSYEVCISLHVIISNISHTMTVTMPYGVTFHVLYWFSSVAQQTIITPED